MLPYAGKPEVTPALVTVIQTAKSNWWLRLRSVQWIGDTEFVYCDKTREKPTVVMKAAY